MKGGSLIILVALFAVIWVVMIRPQRTRQQNQRSMLDSVEPGDEVLTVGGLYGIVQEIDEEGDLVVEIADGIHVRIARRAVATVVRPDEDDDVDEDEDRSHSGEVGADTTSTSPALTAGADEEPPAA